MPTIYKRKPGSRKYIDYSKARLKECLDAVKNKSMSQRKAAEFYNNPRSTIKLKLKKKHQKKPGGPTVFTEEEERCFVDHILTLSENGFPMTQEDLIFTVKSYLTSQGRTIKKFKNNLPGKDWVKSFISRHRELTLRFANNIKKALAMVSMESISQFFDHLNVELEGVPAENIYNYDETNWCDDPGKRKVICRRGCKHPEKVINSSKASTSVMFCGNAAGKVVPRYIIYKAEHLLWTTWTENGPPGVRYNRTKSGWIDGAVFEEWFINHLLPISKHQDGKKVVIGEIKH